MRTSWREVDLEDVASELTVGHVGPMVTEYRDHGIPFIRSTDIEPFRINRSELKFINPEFHAKLKKSTLRPGDVVIVRTGKPGTAAVIPDELPDANCSDVVIVRTAPALNPHYLVYYVNSAGRAHVNAHSGGAVQQHFNVGAARRIRINLPPIEEQREIVDVLGALDDKIELNRRMNATLEAMAQAVFKEWFVARNAPGGEKEEWEEKTIADLADINTWSLGKNDVLDMIDYIEISEVNRGDIGKVERYTRGEEPGRAKRRLRNGDTVMSTVRPDRGAYFLCLDPAKSLIASSGFAVITPTKAPWSFIHAALTQPEVFDYLGQQADGGAYPAVRPEIIGAYPVAWPEDQKVFDRFHEIVAPLYERAAHNRNESRTLAALRDTLLPKLMRGEVRVKENAIDI